MELDVDLSRIRRPAAEGSHRTFAPAGPEAVLRARNRVDVPLKPQRPFGSHDLFPRREAICESNSRARPPMHVLHR
jgi:hypothetical protein